MKGEKKKEEKKKKDWLDLVWPAKRGKKTSAWIRSDVRGGKRSPAHGLLGHGPTRGKERGPRGPLQEKGEKKEESSSPASKGGKSQNVTMKNAEMKKKKKKTAKLG